MSGASMQNVLFSIVRMEFQIFTLVRQITSLLWGLVDKNEILGDVANDRELLKWVKRQYEGDDIEDVNAVIVDKITKGEVGNKDVYGDHNIAAVLFCKKLLKLHNNSLGIQYYRQTRRHCVW